MAEKPTPSYRWSAFTHWANLAFLAAGGVAGATIDPSIWALMVPAQALVLWLTPDLPLFRRAVEQRFAEDQRELERAYYLEQLWGLAPLPPQRGLKSLFVSAEGVPVDSRVTVRSADFERYLEMRDIVRKLREMVPLANGRVTDEDIERLERVIIGYLRLLFACRPLGRAVSELDEAHLDRELAELRGRLEKADGTLRPVLLERKRLLDDQATRLPRLRATLELMRSRAEAIPYQLRSLHSQVLTEPGTGVQAMLDDMIERHEMLRDPLSDLEADEAVREFLAEAPKPVTYTRRAQAKVAAKH
jgi:hypothetical protein